MCFKKISIKKYHFIINKRYQVQKKASKECKLSKLDVAKASSLRHEVYFQKGKAAMKSKDHHRLASAIKLFDQVILK